MASEPPEREVQHDPQVLTGEDEIPHQPEDRRAYGAGGSADAARWTRPALWIAIAILAAVAAVVIWAIVA